MSEMLQRVIKAISQESVDEPDYTDFDRMARAAIAAMREPTEAMIMQAYRTSDCTSVARHFEVAFRAMIDEVLK